MRKNIVNVCLGLVGFAHVALIAGTGLGGCVGADPAPVEQAAAVRNVAISAGDVTALPAGEHLRVDLRSTDVVYHFRLHDPIDFSRVDLVAQTGEQAAMETVIRQMQAQSLDPLRSLNERFVITANASNFTELSAAELQELQDTGKVVLQSRSDRPQATPQTVDDCVPQTIIVEVEVVIDGVTYIFFCVHVIPCDTDGDLPPDVPTDELPR